MRISILSLAVFAPTVLLLCGCINNTSGTVSSAPAATEPPKMAAACNAAPAQFAVGQLADARLEDEARLKSGAKISRVLKPDQMVTKEFNTSRLNLYVDQSGRVLRVQCG